MAEEKHYAIVRYERGQINYQQMWHIINLEDPNGYYPLHDAARSGDIGSVRSLLAAGVDVNQPTSARSGGYTALYLARFNGRQAVVRLLIEWGATEDRAVSVTQESSPWVWDSQHQRYRRWQGGVWVWAP